MDKDVIMWIFGIMISGAYVVIGAAIGIYIVTVQRITKIETTLEYLGYNASKALHSPHTPELDALLEKYAKAYEDSAYDLPYEDWVRLEEICQEIIGDKELPNGYRAAAALVASLCRHKLIMFPARNPKKQ